MLFSKQFKSELSQHLAERFCILSDNAAVSVLLLHKAFSAGHGLGLLGRIVRNARQLSRERDFATKYVLAGVTPVLSEAELHVVVGGFSRYFFVRLPTILNARIRGRGRATRDEISDISKRVYLEFSRRCPAVADIEIQSGLFEEFFSVLRDIKRPRLFGASRYGEIAFRYDHQWLFERLENSNASLKALSDPKTTQPIAVAVDDQVFQDGEVLFALTMRDCFSIFLNTLEAEYSEALLLSPIGAEKAF